MDNLLGTGLDAGADMCARMENQQMASAGNRTLQFFIQKFHCQLKSFRLYCIPQVDDVRGVYNNLIDSVFLHIFPCGFDIQLADIFAACVLRSPGVKHKRVCSV